MIILIGGQPNLVIDVETKRRMMRAFRKKETTSERRKRLLKRRTLWKERSRISHPPTHPTSLKCSAFLVTFFQPWLREFGTWRQLHERRDYFKDYERRFTKMEQKGDWPQWRSRASYISNVKSESCICCVSTRTSLMPSETREVMHVMSCHVMSCHAKSKHSPLV